MADITPPLPAGRQRVEAYGGYGFRIAGVRHEGSVLVLPESTRGWEMEEADAVTLDSLAPILAVEETVEVLLIGSGSRTRQLDPAVRRGLREKGIGVEVMDTGAACRTFNVLLAEDRAVAAALIAVE